MQKKPERLRGIDTIRCLSAFLVVLGHALHFVNELPVAMGGGVRIPLFGGGLGATLLLFTAGFMSVYTAWNRFGVEGQSFRYLKRRAARLVPLYWFYTTLWLVVALAIPSLVTHSGISVLHVITSYFFIPFSREDGGFFPILSLGWTMNYIFVFDVITAIVLLGRREYAFVTILLVCAAAISVHPFVENVGPLYFWTGKYLVMYAAGATAAFLYRYRQTFADKWAVNGPFSFALLVALSLLASAFLQGPTTLDVTRDFLFLFPIATAMGIVAVLTRERGSSIIASVRNKMAASSYSIYLSHPFILGVFVVAWKKSGLYEFIPGSVLLLASVVGSIFGGYVAHRFLEVPINRAVDKLFSRSAARGVEPVAGGSTI